MNSPSIRTLSALSLPLLLAALPSLGQNTAPTVAPGYTLSVFAKGVDGAYSAPDSIAVFQDHIYVGFGNKNDPGGLDGKSNFIVEYTRAGVPVYAFAVKGHNDGLKVNPFTKKLWALQNEDTNPMLVVFDPEFHTKKTYTFAQPAAAGGGYDDMVFMNGKAYLSASNPANSPKNEPAIVEAQLEGSMVVVTPVLNGTAVATDVTTGKTAALNLQDPDSMTMTPGGDLLLDSQGDSELVVVRQPQTAQQSALVVPLNSPLGQPQVDDTLFTPSYDGFILITDTAANTVYKLEKGVYAPGVAYSAGVAGATATPGFVGRLDLEFGVLTPVVSGLNSPHGLAFVNTGAIPAIQ